MTNEEPNLYRQKLTAALNLLPLSVNSWAHAAKINESTLRSFIKGKTNSLRQNTYDALVAAAAEVAQNHDIDLSVVFGDLPQSDSPPTVWVKGLVGAGAEVRIIEGLGDGEGLYQVATPPGMPANNDYIAFEIRGFSMPPAQERWIIYCLNRDTVQPAEAVGKPCIVELTDGRLLFKMVRRGYKPGHFNLESWDGSPLVENVELVRAQPFVFASDPAFVRL